MNGENGNCFCFLNGGKNVLYRKKEKEVFVMFIYKKNCFKIIKIGIFLKNLWGWCKKGCCFRKGLFLLFIIEICLFKKKNYYFVVLNGYKICFFGYEFIKLRFNREIVNLNKKGIWYYILFNFYCI